MLKAHEAEGYVDIAEHLTQSIGYMLYEGTAPVYNRASGNIEQKKLSDILPNILIRPMKMLQEEIPIIDLRDSESLYPYVTWFSRSVLPASKVTFGWTNDASYWEINLRLPKTNLVDYDRIQGFLASLLMQHSQGLDIYFWHRLSESVGTPPSRGDVIAQGTIQDLTVVPRVELATARGEDSYIVVNFTVQTWKAEVEIHGEGS